MSGRILVVNPNTNPDTTEMLYRHFVDSLGAVPVEVTAVTALQGPRMITTPEALDAAAEHVVRVVQADIADASVVGGGRPDAVVVGAFGDPGVPELRELSELDGTPVIGIGEASVREATADGDLFAIATTTGELEESLAALVDRAGGTEMYTGLELTDTDPLVLATSADSRGDSRRELATAVDRALVKGARRVVIGGGPLSDAARDLVDDYPGVIVEPLGAAARWVSRAVAAPE